MQTAYVVHFREIWYNISLKCSLRGLQKPRPPRPCRKLSERVRKEAQTSIREGVTDWPGLERIH